MINRETLLADLQKFLQRIEMDLLERSESTEVPEVPAALHAEYEKAAKAERTAQNYEDWRTDTITQAAAAWVLSCVFVRFLEDNSLIDPPKIAGPGDRLARARDEHELYFRSHPQHTDREYLHSIFVELAKLPGTREIFGEHNAINDLPNWLSGDAAGELLNFFQKIDASTGELVHDFTDPNWDTRFLGDLYQDLSEAARKKFALLQTPDFVEEFILDRTLEPAIEEFGLVLQTSTNDVSSATRFKMIDPACGSGHFLLGAFPRLLDRWQRKEPGTNIRELTQRALDSIHGVDINPFAVAIAKFRLLLVATKACDIQRLASAPAFHVNVACGDSLLHGENRTSSGQRLWDYAEGATDEELYSHAYPGEDLLVVRSFLKPGGYQCVVANPPYIVPKDRKLGDWYRKRFSACHMQYSLAVPFMQQIFQLACDGGFTGQITANSFIKREFGKKLIEAYLPTIELTHVVDTSGAYIPGHGTPTVILFGRNRTSSKQTIRTVMGIRGEPSTPDVPAMGLVWQSIQSQIDHPNTQSDYLSVSDSDRQLFARHPWSIGGGGASELKMFMDEGAACKLGSLILAYGRGMHTGADDAYFAPVKTIRRYGVDKANVIETIKGEEIRDWEVSINQETLFPYNQELKAYDPLTTRLNVYLWPLRTILRNRRELGGTHEEIGLTWFEWSRFHPERLSLSFRIGTANIATHFHAYFDKCTHVYDVTAPMIRLANDAGENEHLAIVGLLNSSSACFWMKQVCHQKQMMGGDGIRIDSKAKVPYAFNSTAVENLPIPSSFTQGQLRDQLISLTRLMVDVASEYEALGVSYLLTKSNSLSELQREVSRASERRKELRAMQVHIQEEIDFVVYAMYGIASANLGNDATNQLSSCTTPGNRPFCIESQSNEDGFEVPKEVPKEWPKDLQDIWLRRKEAIRENEKLRLIEHAMYKRRWIGRQGLFNHNRAKSDIDRPCVQWLSSRLEAYADFDGRMLDDTEATVSFKFGDNELLTVAKLADVVNQDQKFLAVGALLRDDPAFDVQSLVEELVLADSVPHLPILRYKDSGLRKRAEWEKTWDLQRREDAGEAVGTIPVPPKYTSADFISTGGARYWSLRGKLDVPKERWISFPHCEGPDGTLVICWAGYDHLQQAQAISAYYVRVQTEFGGSDDPRLIPLLASLIELLPWLKQWHNEPNANFDGLRMGDYFEGFVNEEARNLGKTLAEIKAWVPPARTTTRGRRKTT
jgi:type I restriction-modification system DNA methylase subunit